ncbi:hypothetical protein CIB48_g4154 [Xylaria polymorpha]|nr:hypothetical protein CIB48_g4154 [Xylaria polymorpha]
MPANESSRDHLMKISMSADGSRSEAVKFNDDPNILLKKDSAFAGMRTSVSYFFQDIIIKRNKKAQLGGL